MPGNSSMEKSEQRFAIGAETFGGYRRLLKTRLADLAREHDDPSILQVKFSEAKGFFSSLFKIKFVGQPDKVEEAAGAFESGLRDNGFDDA